jgi:hypothetical protein
MINRTHALPIVRAMPDPETLALDGLLPAPSNLPALPPAEQAIAARLHL